MQPNHAPQIATDPPVDLPADLVEVNVDDFLAQMAAQQAVEDGVEGPRGGKYLATGGVRHRPKLRYGHKAMADLLLMDPTISQNKLAAIFGRTPGWVSTIITSDAFQSFLAARREQLIDPEITLSLRERAVGVATQSMRILQEKLSKPADQVSEGLALRAFELSAKAVGLGGNAPPPPPPNPLEYLPAIAERLMRLQGRGPAEPISDAMIVEAGASE